MGPQRPQRRSSRRLHRLRGLCVRSPSPIKKADTTWVEPRFEADIAYTEITGEGMLRHPSFKGLVEVGEAPVSRMCMDVFS
jgi:ATP-dependent DNA ligase